MTDDVTVPAYIVDGLRRQPVAVLREVRDLVDDLIDEREVAAEEREEAVDGADQSTLDAPGEAGKGYVIKWQQCGSDNCEKCPHGPYKYKVPEWSYVGKVSPDHPDAPERPEPSADG